MLESLLATLQDRDDWELVLIDDGSTDGTREWLDTLHLPRLSVIKNLCNQGFARSNNIAVAQCRGEVLVLANNDLVFTPGWLQPILDVLQDPSRQAGLVGNVQTRVVDGGLDHTGVDLNFRGQLDHIRVPPVAQGLNVAAERFAVTAACIAMRRELFVSLGGFDEAYVNGCEDMDLCFKLTAAGWRNWVALGSVVQHHVSLSRGTASTSHERNSEVLHARWGAHLQQRLAQKFLAWLQHGEANEPLDGRDDMLKPLAGRGYSLADAEGLARCVLQRNGLHRDRLLGRTPPEPPYSEVRCDGGLVASVLHGYAHHEGEVVFHLPAGVGLHGVFVLGQVAGMPPGGAPWYVTLEINRLQRLRFALNGLDFNVGTHRPLVWSDRPSKLRVGIETPSDGAGRLYLSRLVVDDGVELMVDRWTEQLAFEDTTRLTAPQWAALSPEAFVQHAYWALLGRAADPNGFESYAARLRLGLSRADLWKELSASDEAAQQRRQQAGVASG